MIRKVSSSDLVRKGLDQAQQQVQQKSKGMIYGTIVHDSICNENNLVLGMVEYKMTSM